MKTKTATDPHGGWRAATARLRTRLSPRASQFAGALSWNLAGHAVMRTTVLVAGLVITRSLGVDAFADFAFYLFSINLLAAFSDMGVSLAMMKYGVVARLHAGGGGATDRLAASLQLGLAGFVLSLLAMVMLTRVSHWPRWEIAALGIAGLAAVWQITFGAVLISMRRLRDVFVGNALFAAVLLAGVVAGAVTESRVPAMFAYPAGTLVQCFYQSQIINRAFAIGYGAWLRPRFAEMPAIFGLIGYMAPTSLIASALPWAIANIQLAQHTGKTAVAVFGAATMLFGLTMTVPSKIAQLFFIDQVEQQNAEEGARRIVYADLRAVAISLVTALGVSAVLFLSGDLLLDRYGPQIAEHSTAIFALAAVAVIVCPYQIIGNRMVSAGWQKFWLPITVVQGAVLLTFVWLSPLSPEWTPPTAYWISYAVALVVAIPFYLHAARHARA